MTLELTGPELAAVLDALRMRAKDAARAAETLRDASPAIARELFRIANDADGLADRIERQAKCQ